jgi:hypothetical protein
VTIPEDEQEIHYLGVEDILVLYADLLEYTEREQPI